MVLFLSFTHAGLSSVRDLLPSPEEHQTWGTGSFFAFWFSESMNTSTWAVASSMITLGMCAYFHRQGWVLINRIGMTWWHAILVVFSANMLSSVILVLNGYASSGWHIGYPVRSGPIFRFPYLPNAPVLRYSYGRHLALWEAFSLSPFEAC